jgi:hypothetical protein
MHQGGFCPKALINTKNMINSILKSLFDSFLCLALTISLSMAGWLIASLCLGHYASTIFGNLGMAFWFIVIAVFAFIKLDRRG